MDTSANRAKSVTTTCTWLPTTSIFGMDDHIEEDYVDEMDQLIQGAMAEVRNLETPDWNEWESYCLSIGITCPPEGDTTILKEAKSQFPKIDKRGFSSMFGASWQVYQTLFRRYFCRLMWFSVLPRDLLWTYNRLSTNLPFDALATIWNVSRSNMFARVKYTLSVLRIVLDEVRPIWLLYTPICAHFSTNTPLCCQISWEKKPHQPAEFVPQSGPLNGCTWIVDCIECPIAEPSDNLKSQAFWSGKDHRPTMKYEVACHISSGRVLHISGGVSGAVNDRDVLRSGGLWRKAPENENGIADRGYTSGEWNHRLFTPLSPIIDPNGLETLSFGEGMYNNMLSSLRIEIERLFERFKNYSVLLHSRDRNQLSHREVFIVIANTVNISLEVHPLRSEVSRWILNPPNFPLPPRQLARMRPLRHLFEG